MVRWDESKTEECVVTGIQITKEKKNQSLSMKGMEKAFCMWWLHGECV